MKNYLNKLFLSVATLTLVMSCNSDDDNGVSAEGYTPVAITASSVENNVTVMENAIVGGMASYTITATIPSPQVVHTIMNLSQTGGTAVQGLDFDFDHNIIISPGDTSGTATVNVYASGDIETSDDTFTLTASTGDDKSFLTSPFSFSGTITDDYINDVLDIELSWDGEFEDPDFVTIHSFCNMDFDVLIYEGTADTQIYDAATGACPEMVSLSNANIVDGVDYTIIVSLYNNPFISLAIAESVPLKLAYNIDLIDFSGVLDINEYTTDSGNDTNIGVATIVKNGNEYTVTPF